MPYNKQKQCIWLADESTCYLATNFSLKMQQLMCFKTAEYPLVKEDVFS